MTCVNAFQGFGQALLAGATCGLDHTMQISPDKNVMFRCTSSPFTCVVVWNGFARDGAARLTTPALYGVSVRNLTALMGSRLGGVEQTQRLRTRSQASLPRSVTLAQLPSSSTCLSTVVIWYTEFLKVPVSYRGLSPHNIPPMPGAPMRWTEVAGDAVSNGNHNAATRSSRTLRHEET